MPNVDNNNDSENESNNASLYTINEDACKKYGITLSDIPVEPVEPYSRYNRDDTVYGFVTEVTHDQKGTEVEFKDWGYCLEENHIELGFNNMHRSEIMEEVIKTYGLVPIVDLSGLADDTISWNNQISHSSGSDGGSLGSSGDANIDALVKGWCQGKSSELDKAKAIHEGLRDEVGITYRKYTNTQYHTASKCLEHSNNPGLNCGDTAILTTACMKAGGLNAYIVLRCDRAHFFTVIEIGGQKYYSDLVWSEGQRSRRPFNEVWQGNTCGSKYNLK